MKIYNETKIEKVYDPLDNTGPGRRLLSSGLNNGHRKQQPQLSYVTITDNYGGNYIL